MKKLFFLYIFILSTLSMLMANDDLECWANCSGTEEVEAACFVEPQDESCLDVWCDFVEANYNDEGESCWDDCDESMNPELGDGIAVCSGEEYCFCDDGVGGHIEAENAEACTASGGNWQCSGGDGDAPECVSDCEGFGVEPGDDGFCEWFDGLGGFEAECLDECDESTIEELINIMDEFCGDDGAVTPADFSFNTSSQQAFWLFESVTVDGIAVEIDDWVGAFKGETCVGAIQWNTDICGGGICTLPVMGADGTEFTDGYMVTGDIPTFKIYVALTGEYLDAVASEEILWADMGMNLIENLQNMVTGCTDSSACNFDENANVDDTSCTYAEELYDCDGNCTAVEDCAGACGGSAVADECGECNGSGIADGACDCDGNVEDCAGACGGSAVADECGECNGDGPEENYDCDGNCTAGEDCAGVCAGSSELDDCGICDGANSTFDCADICSGSFSSGTWTNAHPFGLDGQAPELSGSADDGTSWSLSSCIYLSEVQEMGDSTVTLTTVYGADASHPCELSSDIYNGVVTSTNISTHSIPDMSIIGDITFVLEGDNFNAEGTGSFTGYDTDGSLFGALSGVSSGGAVNDCLGKCDGSAVYDECSVCDGDGSSCVDPTWRLNLLAELDVYNIGVSFVSDTSNYLGVAVGGTWLYDHAHDIPETPNPPGNYVKLFFPHPEWDEFETNYTEDIVKDDTSFFSTNLTQWDVTVESNAPGNTTVAFSVDNTFGAIPTNYQMYALLDGEYSRISHDTTSTISFYMDGTMQKDFSVFIGNIVPQAPDNLVATPDYASISLDWDADGTDLSDIGNRYPATSYNVYRDDQPADPGGNKGVYAPGDGPDGCGGLLTGSSGQSGSYYNDNPDTLYSAYPDEGLLQESRYCYTVTGSNLAGESSYGHTVRTSGNIETWYEGRDSRALTSICTSTICIR